MSRRTVITGGAGFIGSHLADGLIAAGWHVTAFDDLSVGRRENVAHLGGNPRFALAEGDIADPEAIAHVVKEARADTIFHLAAVHYIPYCNAHPFDTMRVNVLGTQAVVDAALASGVRKIVFTSTSDVYAPKDVPHSEADPLDPYTVYGTSKLFAERLLALTTARHGHLSATTARLFNVYGPRETNPHVLPEILGQLKRTTRQSVRLGNTWPRRDFVYVEDVTAALLHLADTNAAYDVFNVGTGEALSIDQVTELVGDLLESDIRVITDPERVRPVERGCLQADIAKIRSSTSWTPRWPLREGLARWLAAEGLPS